MYLVRRLSITHHIDVFAIEFFQKFGETLAVCIDADGFENFLDVGLRGVAVASKAEEEVCREMLHFEIVLR